MTPRADPWDARRVATWAGALVFCWALSAFVVGWLGARTQPVDYLSFWGAGRLVLDGHPEDVYDIVAHHEATEAFTGLRDEPVLPWLLPPHALFFATGLAILGYFPGVIVWTLAGAAAFAIAARDAGRSRVGIIVALAIPPTAWNLQIGQVGFVIAVAMYWAISTPGASPMRRGLALVVLSLKPQFGLLIVVYLILERRWKTLLFGLLVGSTLVGASAATFGPDRWIEFLERSGEASTITDLISGPLVWKSQSIFGLFRGLGVSAGFSALVHVAFSTLILAEGIRLTRRDARNRATLAYVIAGSIALSPRTLPYDLQALALCGLLVFTQARSSGVGVPRWELLAAFATSWLMFIDLPGGLAATVLVLHAASRTARAANPEHTVNLPGFHAGVGLSWVSRAQDA